MWLQLIYCWLGLQISYLTWGILQERIITQEYNDSRFQSTEMLVLCNRIVAVVLALIIKYYYNDNSSNTNSSIEWTKMKYYSLASFSNVASSWFQYEALKYIPFPFQVLSKSTKLLFSMIMGRIVLRKELTYKDIVVGILIASGLTIYQGMNSSTNNYSSLLIGMTLLLGYIVCDSFTSTWQEHIFTFHPTNTSGMKRNEMMLGINLWSILFSLIILIGKGELISSYLFIRSHPECLFHISLMSLCASIGQLFIYYTIENFGAVIFVSIMTSRQLLSIVLSILLFGHPITIIGGIGLGLTFTGLYLKLGSSRPKKLEGGEKLEIIINK